MSSQMKVALHWLCTLGTIMGACLPACRERERERESAYHEYWPPLPVLFLEHEDLLGCQAGGDGLVLDASHRVDLAPPQVLHQHLRREINVPTPRDCRIRTKRERTSGGQQRKRGARDVGGLVWGSLPRNLLRVWSERRSDLRSAISGDRKVRVPWAMASRDEAALSMLA